MAARSLVARVIGAAILVGILTSGAPAQTSEAIYFEKVFAAIRRNFPADFDRIVVASHGPNASTEPARMISQLFRAHLPDIGRAPAADLLAIVTAERDFLLALQKHSDASCAMYGTTREVSQQGLPDTVTGLGLEMGMRKWDAARAGVDHPVERPTKQAAAEDRQAWIAAMRKAGASDHLIELIDGSVPEASVTSKDLCQAHLIEISSITLMPAKAGGNIAALRYSSSQ
jgi:hypothetical protein